MNNFWRPGGSNPPAHVVTTRAANLMLNQTAPLPQPPQQTATYATIPDNHTFKETRTQMVDLVTTGRILCKTEFDQLFIDLRRTQEYARQMSLPEKAKLQFKHANEAISTETAWKNLVQAGLVRESDDDKFVKLLIWRQHLRSQPNYEPPTFADVRQWIGMLYRNTLEDLAEETNRFKNSKPRTRAELFLRLYLLARISGVELEFHHYDFRSI
mmetsp:Transcript_6575/g.16758  ORF Transcript_6575/g.16758 Transcript_6575/m.16758 type:complete len:213 (-) Transcript_6575:256-894(-)